jgi:O-glycosyl hydrolase
MQSLLSIAAFATLSTLASAAWAVDCTKWQDHKPGYCGVVSTDKQCDSASNRVPGKCAIPAAAWYVDPAKNLIDNASQSVMAGAGSYALLNPDGSPVALVASGAGNLVASGAGNLVASGAGNLTGRSLQSVGGKKVFILKK